MTTTSMGRRIASPEDEVIFLSRLRPVVALPLVIWCHYSAGSAAESLMAPTSGHGLMLRRIADNGFVVIAHDLGVAPRTNWGNAEAQARLASVKTWGQANLPVASGGVHLIGASMGCVAALRYAHLNPASTRSVTAILPAVHMEEIRATNLTLRSAIDTAWGVTYPAPLPAGVDPWSFSGDLTSLPYLSFTSSDDDFTEDAIAFADAVGGTSYDLGAEGHDDQAIGVVPVDVVTDFMRTH